MVFSCRWFKTAPLPKNLTQQDLKQLKLQHEQAEESAKKAKIQKQVHSMLCVITALLNLIQCSFSQNGYDGKGSDHFPPITALDTVSSYIRITGRRRDQTRPYTGRVNRHATNRRLKTQRGHAIDGGPTRRDCLPSAPVAYACSSCIANKCEPRNADCQKDTTNSAHHGHRSRAREQRGCCQSEDDGADP